MDILTKKKQGLGAFALMLVPGAAGAEVAPGCYGRSYSEAHLAANPAQVVRELRLSIGDPVGEGIRGAHLWVVSREAGALMEQALICSDLDGQPVCQVECDGGGFTVLRQDAQGLLFETDYLLVDAPEDGCGGLMDLAEVPDQAVRYRLDALDAALCEGD